jgi:hypothetical protein
MRMWAVSPVVVVALGLGLAIPAFACDQYQQVSNQTVLAFLSGRGVAAQSVPGRQLAACKEDGSTCTADTDCCSSACKPIAEGRACVPK